MELGVKLLPDFFDKAELAELGEDGTQEVFLIHCHVVLCDLEQHWFGLTEVSSGHLAEQES